MTALNHYKSEMAKLANARKLYSDDPGELKCIASEEKLVKSEFEAMQVFPKISFAKLREIVTAYEKALSAYNNTYYNVYYYEINGMCIGYEPTEEEKKWLDEVDIWNNIVLSGKFTLAEAVIGELLSYEHSLRRYNRLWKRGRFTNIVAVGYQVHIYCSDEFRKKVKNWLIEKGLIDPTLKGGYDKKYFA